MAETKGIFQGTANGQQRQDLMLMLLSHVVSALAHWLYGSLCQDAAEHTLNPVLFAFMFLPSWLNENTVLKFWKMFSIWSDAQDLQHLFLKHYQRFLLCWNSQESCPNYQIPPPFKNVLLGCLIFTLQNVVWRVWHRDLLKGQNFFLCSH